MVNSTFRHQFITGNFGAFIAIAGLALAAYQHFKPSEEKLPAEEQYALAHQYLEGNGTDKNVKRGGELLELAAEKGHVKSMVELGMYAKEGKAGRKKDYGEALKWFELAAEEGDGRALCEIGLLYEKGHGVEKDQGKALIGQFGCRHRKTGKGRRSRYPAGDPQGGGGG